MESELQGKRAIGWLRCSTDKQVGTSITDQETVLRKFAADHGVIIVDIMRLEGYSASVESNLDRAVASVIERKASGEEFDLLLVHDASRFSRTGARHASKLVYELERSGIQLVAAMGYQPQHEFSETMQAVDFMSSRSQVRGLAETVARGSQSSLERRCRAHCSVPPFGIDKLILTSDRKPLHILRELPGGGQVRLDPLTKEELERTEVDGDGHVRGRYVKPKGHLVELIPGEDHAQQAVCQMMRRYHHDGWGLYRIAKELNTQGIRPMRGLKWSLGAVKLVVENPTYTGYGIANRYSRAIYYERRPEMPKAVPIAQKGKRRVRPSAEWRQVVHPSLEAYLPADLRARVVEEQAKLLVGPGPQPAKKRKDKHADSPYLLSGLLRAKGSNEPLRGYRHSVDRRYYRVTSAFICPEKSGSAKLIRAEPLEELILGIVQDALLAAPELHERVVQQTKEWMNARDRGRDRAAISRQVEEVNKQIAFVDENLQLYGKEVARQRLIDLARERDRLADTLRDTNEWPSLSETELEELAATLLSDLAELGSGIRLLPASALKALLRKLVSRAEVDLAERHIELVVRIPSWASVSADGGVNFRSAVSSEAEATSTDFGTCHLKLPLPVPQRGPKRRPGAQRKRHAA